MATELIDGTKIYAETWVHGEAEQPSVLILFRYGTSDYRIYNPTEKIFIHLCDTYREAAEWLAEDEYEYLEGIND